MVTLHEVITFLVSMQISISSLQTHNVNRCGRSRHLARKLSLRRKRSSPNVFEMAATETITSIILIKLIRVKIGRASCRERVWILEKGGIYERKEEDEEDRDHQDSDELCDHDVYDRIAPDSLLA